MSTEFWLTLASCIVAQISELYMFGNEMGEDGIAEFLKLLEDAPDAQENVPLDVDKALAFAMGTHSR